jgi:hypothetical protein
LKASAAVLCGGKGDIGGFRRNVGTPASHDVLPMLKFLEKDR